MGIIFVYSILYIYIYNTLFFSNNVYVHILTCNDPYYLPKPAKSEVSAYSFEFWWTSRDRVPTWMVLLEINICENRLEVSRSCVPWKRYVNLCAIALDWLDPDCLLKMRP